MGIKNSKRKCRKEKTERGNTSLVQSSEKRNQKVHRRQSNERRRAKTIPSKISTKNTNDLDRRSFKRSFVVIVAFCRSGSRFAEPGNRVI